MPRIVAATFILTLLSAAPVLALQPETARNVTSTGVTKPPGGGDRAGRAGAPYSRASTEADMMKAQRTSAARDKAWDTKMRTTMGSICQGC